MEYETDMLTALTLACEGKLVLNRRGIRQVSIDDHLQLSLEMEDGRVLAPEQLEQAVISDVIQTWREEHPQFFQKILGAMM